jgi:hypothetical protein
VEVLPSNCGIAIADNKNVAYAYEACVLRGRKNIRAVKKKGGETVIYFSGQKDFSKVSFKKGATMEE